MYIEAVIIAIILIIVIYYISNIYRENFNNCKIVELQKIDASTTNYPGQLKVKLSKPGETACNECPDPWIFTERGDRYPNSKEILL